MYWSPSASMRPGRYPPSLLLPLRTIAFAGEPFPIGPLRRLVRHFEHCRLFNFYGPTETDVCTSYEVRGVPPDYARSIPIGQAASQQ